ncbi:hypothetical protein TNCV_4178941 [Trichonephila clavipes]|nr:hypothetical protein TNCV_4178941 [Trichonephila clavipes]
MYTVVLEKEATKQLARLQELWWKRATQDLATTPWCTSSELYQEHPSFSLQVSDERERYDFQGGNRVLYLYTFG